MPGAEICRTMKWTLAIGTTLLIALPVRAWQQGMQNMKTTTDAAGHVCDDMGSSTQEHDRDGRQHGGDDESHVHYTAAAPAARRRGARQSVWWPK